MRSSRPLKVCTYVHTYIHAIELVGDLQLRCRSPAGPHECRTNAAHRKLARLGLVYNYISPSPSGYNILPCYCVKKVPVDIFDILLAQLRAVPCCAAAIPQKKRVNVTCISIEVGPNPRYSPL
jgi:hypothetical protein